MAKQKKTTIADLIPDTKNFNKHNSFGMSLLEKSARSFGMGRSILIDKNNNIIAGNGVVETAGAIGLEEVQIVESDGKKIIAVKRTDIDLNTKRGRELALADNAVGKANLTFDETLIEEVLSEEIMVEWGVGKPTAEEDDFNPPPLEEIKTDIKAGDLFTIGNHKLICGDATDEKVWQRLQIEKTFCCFTSPPYNVGINAKTRGHNASGQDSFYKNDADNKSEDDYLKLISDSLSHAINFTGGVCFNVQQLAGNKIMLHKWLLEFQDYYADIITYDKLRAQPAIANGVLTSRFEWLVIFNGEKKSKRTVPLSSWRGTISNVYQGQPKSLDENTKFHHASFPIHLPSFVIADLMNRCTGIVDCFMGTGTSLIAAHQLGRTSYGIEISPQYCQIILDRILKLDPTLSVTKNGKPYKRIAETSPVDASPNGTHKPTAGRTSRKTGKDAQAVAV